MSDTPTPAASTAADAAVAATKHAAAGALKQSAAAQVDVRTGGGDGGAGSGGQVGGCHMGGGHAGGGHVALDEQLLDTDLASYLPKELVQVYRKRGFTGPLYRWQARG